MNNVATKTRLIAAATLALALAPLAHAADLTVEITDLRSAEGVVKASLVDSADGWDSKAPPVAATGTIPQNGVATLTFADLKPGQYAVMIMHDENSNGALDKNVVGMPLEGYGFSNNPNVMRRATYEEARFDVGADDRKIVVRLR